MRKRVATRLEAYEAKRNFTRTTEPQPKLGKKNGWQFVVQKHDARTLHFDLRLELHGVLKSWAVAKGPSLIAGVKRLAVQTEDHPLGYLEWEGVIPKGEYGAGTMIIWDRGNWSPVGDPEKGLKKGHLQFALAGKRLKGLWDLVRMKPREGEMRLSWLLIKRTDDFAVATEDKEPVLTENRSVISKRSNHELSKGNALRPDLSARRKIKNARANSLPAVSGLMGAKKGILPPFIEPNLAIMADTPPDGARWIHEVKFDGYRIQARLDGGRVQLLTRAGLDWTKRFSSIARALERLPLSSGLLDGEIIVQDESGLSSFAGLQADLKAKRQTRMIYMIFDIMYCEGTDLTKVTLSDRRRVLQTILNDLAQEHPIRFSEHLEAGGGTLLEHACRLGLEGIVSKDRKSQYVSARTNNWIKSKCSLRQEFVIVGYVPSTATRGAIGSLVLGYNENGRLVHAGRVGTGFTQKLAADLLVVLKPLQKPQPLFRNTLAAANSRMVKWVKPQIVAEVEFSGWTNDGLVRQASFKGLREDKDPTEVVLERSRTGATSNELSIASYRLTHPDRVLWHDVGLTKEGLAQFYVSIADWILPHITNRVLSLVRCPSGTSDKCFYVKHSWKGADTSLKLVDVGDQAPMVSIADLRGLMALVQSSVLEIHPWGSQISKLETPDRLIFDLDPGEGVDWDKVVAAALEVRERLTRLKLESFVKTSGGKGLHVVVPLAPRAGWDITKEFCKDLAESMARDSPDKYVAVMTRSRRQGRIFVDYLRNGRGATAIAAYSTRARDGAPISCPVTWGELATGIKSNQFTVQNLQKRPDFQMHDPWDGFFSAKQSLG